MRSNRDAALAYVIKDEGGYAERPEEGGGAVNRGITFTVFAASWKLKGKTQPTFGDLKAMTQEEATDIYVRQYLTPVAFDKLPIGVDYVVLDSAINNGVTGSIKFLQRALKLSPIDGHLGAVTLWAATHRDPKVLINAFCDVRLATQKSFRSYNKSTKPSGKITFGDVWDRRVELVRKRALQMIAA